MATPYEVEHNIKDSAPPRRRRQLDMTTFTAHLNNVIAPAVHGSPFAPSADQSSSSAEQQQQHNNPHAQPTPADLSALFRMLQEQLTTLSIDAPTDANRELLLTLAQSLEDDILRPPRDMRGVSQDFLDKLERVPKRAYQKTDETCPICCEEFRSRDYPLVVELPCHPSHRFELECVGPWLLAMGNCPLCKKDFNEKEKMAKVAPPPDAEEDDEDEMGMFG